MEDPRFVTCRCSGEELLFRVYEKPLSRDWYCAGSLTDPGPVRIHAGKLARFEKGIPKFYCAKHFAEKWKAHQEGCEVVAVFPSECSKEGNPHEGGDVLRHGV